MFFFIYYFPKQKFHLHNKIFFNSRNSCKGKPPCSTESSLFANTAKLTYIITLRDGIQFDRNTISNSLLDTIQDFLIAFSASKPKSNFGHWSKMNLKLSSYLLPKFSRVPFTIVLIPLISTMVNGTVLNFGKRYKDSLTLICMSYQSKENAPL